MQISGLYIKMAAKAIAVKLWEANLLAWSEKQAVVRDWSTSTWSQWRNNNQSGEYSVDSQLNWHFLNVTQPEQGPGRCSKEW